MIQASGLDVLSAVTDPQNENGIVPDPVADQVRVDNRKLSQSTDGLTPTVWMHGQTVGRRLKALRQTNSRRGIERRHVGEDAFEIGHGLGRPDNPPH
jgi:hypothetical protein